MINVSQRLNLLRSQMDQHNIDIYLVPSIDAHNSEYVPECWLRRPWISGFDGSAGEVMVTKEHAYLWTDGRYFLQASQQLDPNHYTLMKQMGFVPETEQWLKDNAKGKRLGIDPQLVGIGRAQQLAKIMESISGEMVVIEENLIDNCKKVLNEQASLPVKPVFALTEKYTGVSLTERLAWLRGKLKNKEANYIALNVLDEIAWFFNIRGEDIEFNPLVISYALIGEKNAWLFVDSSKINPELLSVLTNAGITLADYAEFGSVLSSLTGSIWLDDKTATYWMLSKASTLGKVILARSPIVANKAAKNHVEAQGARVAHLKDAVAVTSFLSWLDNNWQAGVDELSASDKLAEFRSKGENIKGASFATISGFASNGAIIHYRANSETNKVIDASSLYLIDSGGQYLEGTTDITRTVHLGEPTAEQVRHYTLVLKGHLALSRAKFPHGTCGEHLDILARTPLWNEYLNYRHGTGHGVGSFLCVHEGPQKISQAPSGVPLVPGMIVSNEPGLYLDGVYGIRIENLCLVVNANNDKAKNSEYGPFYEFEDLTLVPYCKKLIDITLLDKDDVMQIKTYYKKIEEQVFPLISDKQTKDWLIDQLALFSK